MFRADALLRPELLHIPHLQHLVPRPANIIQECIIKQDAVVLQIGEGRQVLQVPYSTVVTVATVYEDQLGPGQVLLIF